MAEVRLDHHQIDLSAQLGQSLTHGGVLGGFCAENIVYNTKFAQFAVWLPVHMGNVGQGLAGVVSLRS